MTFFILKLTSVYYLIFTIVTLQFRLSTLYGLWCSHDSKFSHSQALIKALFSSENSINPLATTLRAELACAGLTLREKTEKGPIRVKIKFEKSRI